MTGKGARWGDGIEGARREVGKGGGGQLQRASAGAFLLNHTVT